MSTSPARSSGYGAGLKDAGEATSVDARGAMGVQVGEHLTQIITVYSADQRTWTDGMAPPPLANVSGEVESPYRGLAAFEEQDAAFFFGRDQAAADVLGRMSNLTGDGGLLVVSGVSGAGKSSLLRAGVLPRLRAADLAGTPGSRRWPCVVLTPGRAPLDELAVRVALVAGIDAAGVRQGLEADPGGFALTARQAAMASQPAQGGPDDTATADAGGRLLLVVDQFEQVFTRCPDERERRAFVAALHAATTARGPRDVPAALVVLIVRADFEARCAEFDELAEAVQDRYLVTTMTARQLELAIIEPARIAGADVDDRLVRALVDQARSRRGEGTGAGVLPLMSHALDQAWRHRAGTVLTLADYERVGGVEGAVAASAQRAYGQLTPEQQDAARLVFTRLTATTSDGIDVAARAIRAELISDMIDGGQRNVQAVLDAFVAERLLTVGADSVEISHEVLLTAWPLLRDTWLTETHADRIVRTRLTAAAAEWDRQHRDSSYLYSGSVLQAATDTAGRISADPARHPALTTAERDFLRAGRRAQRRASRLRQAAVAALAALATGLAATTALVVRADRQVTYQRDVAIAEGLVSKSQSVGDSDPVLSQLLAVAAWRFSPSPQARLAMLDAAALPGISSIDSGSDQVDSMAFSPDGKTLASGGNDDKVRLWSTATGRMIGILLVGSRSGGVSSVAFSPDGKLLASAGYNGTVGMWNVATGREIGPPLVGSRSSGVGSVAFSPDGKLLASADFDGTVRLWDVATGRPARSPLAASAAPVNSVAFSPDGKLLASGSADGMVRLWDVATGRMIGIPLVSNPSGVVLVAFSPDGKLLASGGSDGKVRLWDVATGREIGAPLVGSRSGTLMSMAFSLDGTLASGGSDGMVRLWDVATGREIGAPLADSVGPVMSVAFSPDGKLLASGGFGGKVRLWGVATGREIGAPLADGRSGALMSVAFSPDGKLLASGDFGGKVRLWDVATGREIGAPLADGRSGAVMSVAFSPDGKLLASGDFDASRLGRDDDGMVRLWDVATGREIGVPLADSVGPVMSVAFSPDGKLLASGGFGGMVRLWGVATGREIGAPLADGRSGAVMSVAFSPDGKLLASGDSGGKVRLWDVATGREIGAPLTGSNSDGVESVAFSPDGELLASGGDDGKARLWDVATGREIGFPLAGSRSGGVSSVAFSPDGKLLASGGDDGKVRLWDVATVPPIGAPLAGSNSGGVYSVGFSPDGKTLALVSAGGTIRLLDVGYLGNVVSYLCALAGRSLTRAEWTRYVPSGPAYRAVCP